MTGWDYLQIAVFSVYAIYLVWTAVLMLTGKPVEIKWYTNLLPEEQSYYDEKKIRTCYGAGNLVSAASLMVIMLGQFGGQTGIALLGVLLFFAGIAVPLELQKRTGYFVKK